MTISRQSLIFAHRGANREAMENTRSAFDRAREYAIDGLETDVQLSRDQVAVLWHDCFLNRLGLPDKHVDDFDYAQLRTMNFAEPFAVGGKPECIMALQEFLAAYRKSVRLLIEIKNFDWEPASRHKIKVRETLALIRQTGGDSIFVSSFNLSSLIYAHHLMPNLPVICNFSDGRTMADVEEVLTAQPFLHGLCLPITTLDEATVKLLRSQGKCIAVYTCNSDEEIGKALGLGVDVLITDVPQKALEIRTKTGAIL